MNGTGSRDASDVTLMIARPPPAHRGQSEAQEFDVREDKNLKLGSTPPTK